MGAVLSTPLIPLGGGGSAGPPWLGGRAARYRARTPSCLAAAAAWNSATSCGTVAPATLARKLAHRTGLAATGSTMTLDLATVNELARTPDAAPRQLYHTAAGRWLPAQPGYGAQQAVSAKNTRYVGGRRRARHRQAETLPCRMRAQNRRTAVAALRT